VTTVKKRIRRRNIVLLAVLLVLAGIAVTVGYLNTQVELVSYEVQRGDVREVVESSGVIESTVRATIYSKQTGFVSEIYFEVGDPIQSGDAFAKITSDDVYYGIEAAKARVSGAKAEYYHAIEKSDSHQIAIGEAAVISARLTYEQAGKAANDATILFRSGAISSYELKAAEFERDQARLALTSAENQLALMKKGASSNLASALKSGVSAAETELKRLQSVSDDMVMAADVSGVLIERMINTGAFVTTGMPVAQIGDVDSLKVISDVLGKEVHKLSPGMLVEILMDDEPITTGRIVKIHPKLFEKVSELGILQKRVKVEIELDGQVTGLLIGQDVGVKFILSEKKDVLLVDKDYVYEAGGQNYVLVNENGKLAQQQVKLGLTGETHHEVTSGLNAGDNIVGEIENTVEMGQRIKWVSKAQ
jgi:HlyD family secretion protein